VFFGAAPAAPALLSDSNEELVNAFVVVRVHVEDLNESLCTHLNNGQYFYEIRAMDTSRLSPVERASRMIYLNRTCFNGLYRVNRKGEFNTPFGNYENPMIVRPDLLRNASRALQGHQIGKLSYQEALAGAQRADLVYLDPPYIPLGGYSDFKRYNEAPFSLDDHRTLAAEFHRLDELGALVILSNSGADLSYDLYGRWKIREVRVPRRVSANPKGRAAVTELLVTNFE
jgi:DNA adenine methylase